MWGSRAEGLPFNIQRTCPWRTCRHISTYALGVARTHRCEGIFVLRGPLRANRNEWSFGCTFDLDRLITSLVDVQYREQWRDTSSSLHLADRNTSAVACGHIAAKLRNWLSSHTACKGIIFFLRPNSSRANIWAYFVATSPMYDGLSTVATTVIQITARLIYQQPFWCTRVPGCNFESPYLSKLVFTSVRLRAHQFFTTEEGGLRRDREGTWPGNALIDSKQCCRSSPLHGQVLAKYSICPNTRYCPASCQRRGKSGLTARHVDDDKSLLEQVGSGGLHQVSQIHAADWNKHAGAHQLGYLRQPRADSVGRKACADDVGVE